MPPQPSANYDEMLDADGAVRSAYSGFRAWYDEQDQGWLKRQDAEAERFFRRTGITFNVYGDDAGEERLIPFDMIPRIITASEWRKLSRGIEQRVRALVVPGLVVEATLRSTTPASQPSHWNANLRMMSW